MGGPQVIRQVGEQVGKTLEEKGISSIAKGGLEYMQSFFAQNAKSETGTFVNKLLQDYEFATKKTAQEIANSGRTIVDAKTKLSRPISPEEAHSEAKEIMQRKHFGNGKEILIKAVNTARAEKGDFYAGSMGDNLSIYLKEESLKANQWRKKAGLPPASPYQSVNDLERKVRNIMSWTFTSRIALPHIAQGLNSVMENGLGPTFKAVADVATNKKAAIEWVSKSGALFDEQLYDWYSLSSGKPGILEKIFHQPGFKQIRKMQLSISALAGKHSAEMEFSKLLQYPDDKGARVQLQVLGLDPESLLRRGKIGEDDLLHAAYKSAADTMFIRSELQTPPRWDATPHSRALSMYKHFMFNETRFLKDALKISAQKGPIELAKSMGVLATLFPAVGYVVKNLELVATGVNPAGERAKEDMLHPTHNDAINQYVDSYAYAAGLGIFYSMMRAANRNAVASYIAGPVIGFGGELTQDAFALAQGKGVPLGRTIARRIPVVGTAVSNAIFPIRPKKHSKEDE